MAFKSIGQGGLTFKKLTDLAVGESVTGYLLGIDTSTKIEGAQNLRLKVDGATISYSVAGNIKYMIRDGELALGQNTRITRLEDHKVKGKKASKFSVEQDAEDTIEGLSGTATSVAKPATSTTSSSSVSIAEKIKGLKANGTTASNAKA